MRRRFLVSRLVLLLSITVAGSCAQHELLRWRGDVAAGKIVGPRILTAGRVLDGAPPANPPYSIVVETAEQARAAVDDLQARGVDCIKVYDVLSREAYFAIAEAAHRRGLPMVGHTPAAISTIEASNAGQATIEHLGKILEDSSSSPAAIRAASGAVYDATSSSAWAPVVARSTA